MGDLGSVLLEGTGDAGLTARGLRENDDLPLTLAPGTGCQQASRHQPRRPRELARAQLC